MKQDGLKTKITLTMIMGHSAPFFNWTLSACKQEANNGRLHWVQIFPPIGFIWVFYGYSYPKILFCFKFEWLGVQPCSVLLHSLPVWRTGRLAHDVFDTFTTPNSLACNITDACTCRLLSRKSQHSQLMQVLNISCKHQFLVNRVRNWMKNCIVYIYIFFHWWEYFNLFIYNII